MHLSYDELAAQLDHVKASPADGGELRLIATRPADGMRGLPTEAQLDAHHGVIGDNWLSRGSRHTPDGAADPDRQVTVMNIRIATLVAGGLDRAPLAGDQLYVDLDLSVDNLPAGSMLTIGTAVLEISAAPHLGCAKFVDRFGAEAMRFVNSGEGRALRLRGLNARVLVPGTVRVGDRISRSSSAAPGGAPAAAARTRAPRVATPPGPATAAV